MLFYQSSINPQTTATGKDKTCQIGRKAAKRELPKQYQSKTCLEKSSHVMHGQDERKHITAMQIYSLKKKQQTP